MRLQSWSRMICAMALLAYRRCLSTKYTRIKRVLACIYKNPWGCPERLSLSITHVTSCHCVYVASIQYQNRGSSPLDLYQKWCFGHISGKKATFFELSTSATVKNETLRTWRRSPSVPQPERRSRYNVYVLLFFVGDTAPLNILTQKPLSESSVPLCKQVEVFEAQNEPRPDVRLPQWRLKYHFTS